MVDTVAFVSSTARIQNHFKRWTDDRILTTLIIRGRFEALRAVAETGLFE